MSRQDNPYSDAGQYASANVQFGSAANPGSQAGGAGPGSGVKRAAGAADPIKDTTTANFAQDVIQESRKQPVLVDLWAPWCGPCKQLTPVLEKAVTERDGKVVKPGQSHGQWLGKK